ncbi:MAG TPA: HEAT repeat domain-containing protein [Nocardioidaceae bacterium]|nr:HEAT repeat domain-containing protein [Nocardioidaceae bacterium]
MKDLFWVLLLVFGGLAASLVCLLVVVRVAGELRRTHVEHRRDAVRRLVLTALLGEETEAERAIRELRTRTGAAGDQVEEQIFAMLPKVKGDSRSVLVEVLLGRGAAGRAYRRAKARSLVRRSRGAYQLGVLGRPDAVPTLLGLLADKRFLVRRVAVRALGQIGEATAVTPLLDAVTADPTLTRDVMAAVRRIGSPAAVPLRTELAEALGGTSQTRRAALTATGLGLLGDVPSTPLLVRALAGPGHPGLPAAAAEALGLIGAPEAVTPLVNAVLSDDPDLRVAAARALGRISDPAAVPGLAHALDGAGHDSDRAVAAALLRLGTRGLAALEDHSSPYAAEALAVHSVRTSA